MGNRGVITTKEKRLAVYLHWNGGRDTVDPLLRYCELQGYRPPSQDCYGWARLCQVIGNFFGGSLCVGIDGYKRIHGQSDNGTYIIDGWRIVGREELYDDFEEQQKYDFDEMLKAFDQSMPKDEQLGEFLDAVEVPVSQLKVGDMVWMPVLSGGYEAYPVAGFGSGDINGKNRDGVPFVKLYDHDGDWSWNPNNYVRGEIARVKRRW